MSNPCELMGKGKTQLKVLSVNNMSSVSQGGEKCTGNRNIKFGIKISSDWPKMGQIWDFLRSVSVHFETYLKKS